MMTSTAVSRLVWLANVDARPVRTTRLERLLLMTAIAALPLEGVLPTFRGTSSLFVSFAILALYLCIWRSGVLVRTAFHPVFVGGYALVGIGLFMELAHGGTGYQQIARILLMILGGVVVASFCRDRAALLAAFRGYLLAGLWLSCLLFLTVHGDLGGVATRDFEQATMLRDRVFDDYLLAADWNAMAFYLVQGVLVAAALALCSSQPLIRLALLLLAAVLAAASLLPMSRGAVVILIISGAAVVLAYGILKPKVILTVAALIVGVFLWVPDAVYQRFAIPVTIYRNETRQLEARTRVYLTTLENLSDSGFTGVSVSQYYGKWGRENLWVKNERVVGTHNVYAQIAMYWGLPGLLALLALVWQAYRCLPARPGTDAIRLCLLGIALSVFLESMFVHTLHGKEFSLALGLLAGSSLWIWPSRSLHAARAPAGAPRNDAR